MIAIQPAAVDVLKPAYRVMLDSVEAINMASGEPASSSDVLKVLTPADLSLLEETYESSLSRVVGRVLNALEDRGLLESIKRGRTRLYYVEGSVASEVCEDLKRPSRRRRVLSLVYRVVSAFQRAVRISEIVNFADGEQLTEEIPGTLIKRDVANLTRTGELTVVDTVRGDGGGSNLYLPSDLDVERYSTEGPLTWMDKLARAFDSVWQERMEAAEAEERDPIPPSTGDVRNRFADLYPGHAALDDPQTIVNGMAQLARTEEPHVRDVRREGQWALLWAPPDVADEQLDLGNAHASDSERITRAASASLVALNLPVVTVRNVNDQIDIEPRLRPAGKLEPYEILSDLARTELHNSDGTVSSRSRQPVIRVGVVDGTTYYTIPGTEGAAEYVEALQVEADWRDLEADRRLDSISSYPSGPIRVGREMLLRQECEEISKRAVELKLSVSQWTDEMTRVAEESERILRLVRKASAPADPGSLPSRVEEEVLGFTPREFLEIIGSKYPLANEEMPAAELVPLFERQIRRVRNPDFDWRFHSDPRAATEMLFDRVSALAYVAYRWGEGEELNWANVAHMTLGRLRDVRFVHAALESDDFADRQVAVASLAFLGDPEDRLPRIAEDDAVEEVQKTASWAIHYLRGIESCSDDASGNRDRSTLKEDL